MIKINIKRQIGKIIWKLSSSKRRQNIMRKKGVKIGKNCNLAGNIAYGTEPYLISIGDNVRITSNVQFVTHDGSAWVLRNLGIISKESNLFGKINIGNNVNIGWNTIVMPGVTIGDNCIIGLGSIVNRDVPSNSVAVGVPAKVICTIEEYYEKHKEEFIEIFEKEYVERKKSILSKI